MPASGAASRAATSSASQSGSGAVSLLSRTTISELVALMPALTARAKAPSKPSSISRTSG